MPIYAYRCTKCQHYFEIKQSFLDEPIKKCPQCGKKVVKQLNVPGIVFKGQGFYKTDHQTESSKKAGKESSSAKGDTKPKKEKK